MISLPVVAILMLAQLWVQPAAADDAATIAELQSAALTLDQAYADEDVETIRRLTTPDILSITPRYGGAGDLERQIASFEEVEREHFDHSPVTVVLLRPDVAFVTFEKSMRGTLRGEPLPARVFSSGVWLKEGDRWLNRTYQETPIATP